MSLTISAHKEAIALRQQRAGLIQSARRDWDDAERRGGLNGEERQLFDRRMGEADKLEKQIAEVEQRACITRQPAPASPVETRSTRTPGRQTEPTEPGQQAGRWSTEYRSAFDIYLRAGMDHVSQRDRQVLTEKRALSAESDPAGGYLATPMEMVNDLIKAVDNAVPVRQLATKFKLESAQSLGVPSLDNDPADPEWTPEVATGSEDSTMTVGTRQLSPRPLAKRIKLSNKLLRLVPSAENLVRDRLAYKFAIAQEQAFMTGDGANKPLGVFVASSQGIPSTRDVSTDNTSTAMTFEGLINAKYSLKAQYLQSKSCAWLFHRDGVKQLMKIRDASGASATTGQFLWQPSVQLGGPDTLLGIPVYQSEYVPNTFTTGLYTGIIGDWSFYWIADSLDVQIQRLVELYAETAQTGFISLSEVDGMPVLGEAFARVQLA